MSKHKKLFIQTDGGLGDNIRQYLLLHSWGTLKGFKERFPDSIIKVISQCNKVKQGGEFFKYNPYIDEIEAVPSTPAWPMLDWEVDGYYNYKLLNNNGHVHYGKEWQDLRVTASQIPYQMPEIYISEEEEKELKEIKEQGKYILVHPFSGTTHRSPLKIDGCDIYIKEVFDSLIDDHGYNIIVVGGNHISKTIVAHRKMATNKEIEECPYTRDGVIDLVNKSNSRMIMRLAFEADGLIGGHSAFVTQACEAKGIRTALLVPEKFRIIHRKAFHRDIEPWVTALCEKGHQYIVWMNKDSDFNNLAQETINWLK